MASRQARITELMKARGLSRAQASKVVNSLDDFRLYSSAAAKVRTKDRHLADEMSTLADKALKAASDIFCHFQQG